MRRQEDIAHLAQWAVGRQRLDLEHVQGSARTPARGIDQRRSSTIGPRAVLISTAPAFMAPIWTHSSVDGSSDSGRNSR